MKDEPYASQAKKMLKQLGLPLPASGEIFHGTNHDLLFLNSHGVVIRIGPTDIPDLVNPAILQPLGWLEDRKQMINFDGKKTPFTVAIYPGIELAKNYRHPKSRNSRPKLVGNLEMFLEETDQGTGDLCENNTGVIRIMNDTGKAVAVEVVIDPDNSFHSSSKELSKRRSRTLKKQERSSSNKSDVISRTLLETFNTAANAEYWQRAFETHQPLRQMFWEAFKDVKDLRYRPNPESLDAFWDKCAQITNRPEYVVMPVWRLHVNAKGGKTYTRKEIHIPNLVLYRQWTDKKQDRIISPIQQPPELKAAVQKAHDRLRLNKPITSTQALKIQP